MKQKHVSAIVDTEITSLEVRMELAGKHIISSDTLRELVTRHIDVCDRDEDRAYLIQVGLTQVIQSRLQNRGYRSVRRGYYVSLVATDNISYLQELLKNQDLTVMEKKEVRERIARQMKIKCDGQSELIIINNEIVGIRETLSESQFMIALMADAV